MNTGKPQGNATLHTSGAETKLSLSDSGALSCTVEANNEGGGEEGAGSEVGGHSRHVAYGRDCLSSEQDFCTRRITRGAREGPLAMAYDKEKST